MERFFLFWGNAIKRASIVSFFFFFLFFFFLFFFFFRCFPLFLCLAVVFFSQETMGSSTSTTPGFVQYMARFDDETKCELMNVAQYALLSLVPLAALNRTMQTYVPEADDRKGSVELSVEMAVQILVMLGGLYLIHRLVTYVPTYSAVSYPTFHLHSVLLVLLMIVMSLQTKLGEKATLLTDRVSEFWHGTKKRTASRATASQPGTTLIDQLPVTGGGGGVPQPDALVRTTVPTPPSSSTGSPSPEGFSMSAEPMPANAVIGGAFGSPW